MPESFLSSDYVNSYRYPVETLNEMFDREVYLENLEFMETYFRKADGLEDPFSWINRHEQTLHALLLTRLGARRLGRDYSISSQPISESTACHHFVSDFSRNGYYTEGLKTLKEKGFLKRIKEDMA